MVTFCNLPAMLKQIFILFSSILFTASLQGQCPDRDILWKRIIYLRDSSKASKEQLAELYGYLNKMNSCPYKNDSTHEALLRRIGMVNYQLADYL